MVAAECNNLQAVQELIRRGADINYQDSVSSENLVRNNIHFHFFFSNINRMDGVHY